MDDDDWSEVAKGLLVLLVLATSWVLITMYLGDTL